MEVRELNARGFSCYNSAYPWISFKNQLKPIVFQPELEICFQNYPGIQFEHFHLILCKSFLEIIYLPYKEYFLNTNFENSVEKYFLKIVSEIPIGILVIMNVSTNFEGLDNNLWPHCSFTWCWGITNYDWIWSSTFCVNLRSRLCRRIENVITFTIIIGH